MDVTRRPTKRGMYVSRRPRPRSNLLMVGWIVPPRREGRLKRLRQRLTMCDRPHTQIAHTFVSSLVVMGASRAIPLTAHAAIETVAGPAIMAAPFAFGFGQAAAVVSFAIGALLLGLAIQAAGPRRTIPLSAHAGFDYLLAVAAAISGLLIGLGTGEWSAGSFLVGIGVAMAALAAATRFSVPAGA